MKNNVSLIEIGECFYAWLDMIMNGHKINFEGAYKDFPLPLIGNASFAKAHMIGKSGTLDDINKDLSRHSEEDLISKIATSLNDHLKQAEGDESHNNLPTIIKNGLDSFFNLGEGERDKAAIIHIRYINRNDDRDMTEKEFEFIVKTLKINGFNKFILIGDLEVHRETFKDKKDMICIDYCPKDDKGKYTEPEWIRDWLTPNKKSLAKQMQLIKLIRENYSAVELLIGRKSGCGLDIHAYAGMPTIFLDNDKNNSRYADPSDWSTPYFERLVPVYFPSNTDFNNLIDNTKKNTNKKNTNKKNTNQFFSSTQKELPLKNIESSITTAITQLKNYHPEGDRILTIH